MTALNDHVRQVDKKPRSYCRFHMAVQNRLARMGKTACRKSWGITLRRVTRASAADQLPS